MIRDTVSKLVSGGWRNASSFLFATLVPTLIFTGVALQRPISFDGGMNLQVSQNLVEKGEYSRSYAYPSSTDEEKRANNRLFPGEVETNGPYIIAGAVGMIMFGQNQLGFQFANLLFIFGSSVVVWWMLRRWLLVATIAPPLVLLLLPNSYDTALGGYGEVPALFFALLSIALLSHAASLSKKSQTLRFLALSLVSAGAAIVTKTYLVGFLPALLVGIIIVKYAKSIPWKSLLSRVPYVLTIPVLYEIWHLVSLGSVFEYLTWWKQQLKGILFQSGLWKPSGKTSATDQTSGIFDKVGNQLDIFISQAGLMPLILISIVVISLLIFSMYYRERPISLRSIWKLIASKYGVLTIVLFTMFATYFVWWLVLLPEAKTFNRRTLPAMFPLSILLSLLIAFGYSFFCTTDRKTAVFKIPTKKFIAGRALFLSVTIIIGILFIPSVQSLVKNYDSKPYISIEDYEDTVQVLRVVVKSGNIYGANWWSSPVVGLMSGRDIRNVELTNVCKHITKNDVFIWDKIASGITKKPDPLSKYVDYSLLKVTEAANLYRITPKNDFCKGR